MPLLLGSRPRRYGALIPHEASAENRARPACSSPRRALHPPRVPLGCWVRGAPLQLWSRVLGPTGTAVPQTRPPTPLGIWGASGHDPAPPRVASFRVESLSAKRPLSPDPAQLCGDRCGQSSNRHPRGEGATFLGHASGSLQLLFRVETLGEWLKPQATPPLGLSPPSPIYQNSIHLHHRTIVIYARITFLRCCWVGGSVTGGTALTPQRLDQIPCPPWGTRGHLFAHPMSCPQPTRHSERDGLLRWELS